MMVTNHVETNGDKQKGKKRNQPNDNRRKATRKPTGATDVNGGGLDTNGEYMS